MKIDLSERDADIAAQYADGISQAKLANQYGISRRHVQRIVQAAGLRLSDAERIERQLAGVRAKVMFSGEPDKRETYLVIRKKVGADEARRLMGVGA